MVGGFALSLPGFEWGDFWRAVMVVLAVPAIGGLIPFAIAVLSELIPEKRRDHGRW